MKNKIIRIRQPDDAPMHLTWMINNICQNSCSYCPPNLHDGKNHYYEWENAKRFFEMLFEKYPRIHCSVSGGEPSMSPFFRDICKIFHEAGHTIGVTSNAAKSVEYWEDISTYLNYISFSWHPEFPDKNFEGKVTAASLKTLVSVRIMMLPSKWDECLDMFNQLSAVSTFITEPVKLIPYENTNINSSVYSEEQLNWFNNHQGNHRILPHIDPKIKPDVKILADYYFDDGTIVNDANASDWVNRGFTNFNDYTCEIGIKSLFVRPNGIIYLGNCLVGGKIGNINQPEKISWPTKPVKCNIDLCHCSSDVNINKWID
jgi:MoaA/NifB/PqqE/SkfB family radical SAM enzyme